MKSVFSFILIALSFNANAGVFASSYKADTIVPEMLQDQIALQVFTKYSCLTAIKEIETSERIEKQDQIRDFFYTTSFEVVSMSSSPNPNGLKITVESAMLATGGVTPEVKDISSSQGEYICP